MTIATQALTSAALNATGLGAALTSTGASYVLTANNAGDNAAHTITIAGLAATNYSGVQFAIVGTDENGRPQSQSIAGPNGVATVTSTKFFLTVTSVTPASSTGADTFNIGWTANSVGPWFNINLNHPLTINVGIGCTVVSGPPTYSIQYTYDAVTWFTHGTISGKTASFDGQQNNPVRALRMSFTGAGGVTTTYIQHDARGQ